VNSGLGAITTYAVLTLVWGAVLALYLRHRREAQADSIIRLLLAVLALDAFKSVLESAYFGLVWAANYGLLSPAFKSLGDPAPLTAVKLINLAVASVVLFQIARNWVPGELARRAEQRTHEAALMADLEANLQRTREAESRLRLAMQNSNAFPWEFDLTTRTASDNPRAAEWLGYTSDEFSRLTPDKTIHPEDLSRLARAIETVESGAQESYELKHRMVRKDGRVLWAHSTGGAMRNADGRITRLVGVIRDITKDVEAEANRVQTQKLESLGLLAGGIAHDFNNLLTVIGSSLDLVAHQARRGEPVAEPLATASLAVTNATALTRQLLAYAGGGTLAQRPVDLNELIASMGQLLSVSVPRKVRLSMALADALPQVKGDVGQLQQVVMNLISNAAEAIGEGEGTVTVTTQGLVLDAPPPGLVGAAPLGPVVKVQISDTGAGMPPELKARIFDPFFSTKGPGRGLGLAALAGILRSHGGAIGLESVVGQGTTFTVYLPALPPGSRTPSAPAEEPTGALGYRVLLVDDEDLLRRSASRLLKSMGCSVEEAENGRAAVELVQANPTGFDVVLMDMTMPEMDGAEATRHLEAIAPSLPIILSSGYSTANVSRVEGRIFGLGKPYTAAALETALKEATQRRR